MFIFRWIRTVLWIIGLGTVIFWGWKFMSDDGQVRGKIDTFRKSPVVQEGVKDLKTWAGEAFKGIGSKLDGDDVTADEKHQLDKLLERELRGKDKEIIVKEVKTIQVKGTGNKEAR